MTLMLKSLPKLGCPTTAEMRQQLIAIRQQRGLSQKQLAQRMGVTIVTVKVLESGRKVAHFGTLQLWARALGCRVVVGLVEE